MRFCFLLVLTLVMLPASAQKILCSKFGKGKETCWLIEPEMSGKDTTRLVVFLHGHGASNPASYGDWILHLAEQGYTVLFPKFQTGVFIPDPSAEQASIDRNIDSAQAYLAARYGCRSRKLHFIGHSLGGILAANLADDYGATGKYEVRSLTLVQPGHKYLKIGALNTYSNIDSAMRIICVSGSNDRTAGSTFSNYLMEHSPSVHTCQKIHFLLERKQHGEETIGSTHEEPVCPNDLLDAGNRNPVIRGADLLGKTDLADRLCFWKMADVLVADPAEIKLSELAKMGKWSDGIEIEPLKIIRY